MTSWRPSTLDAIACITITTLLATTWLLTRLARACETNLLLDTNPPP